MVQTERKRKSRICGDFDLAMIGGTSI
jgi:hypothetical protein